MTETPQISGGGVLGKQVQGPRRQLDTFEAPRNNVAAVYTSDEVTAVCPITGQPDWYTVRIQVTNSRKLLESKALKLYLQSFREEGMFCEAFADRICEDVSQATNAQQVVVTVKQKARGGITIEASSAKTRQHEVQVGEGVEEAPGEEGEVPQQ